MPGRHFLGHEQVVGVGAQHNTFKLALAQVFASLPARTAEPARRGGRRHHGVAFAHMADPAADSGDIAGTLMPEWPKGDLGVPPPIGLDVSATGACGADAQQDFAGAWRADRTSK